MSRGFYLFGLIFFICAAIFELAASALYETVEAKHLLAVIHSATAVCYGVCTLLFRDFYRTVKDCERLIKGKKK